MPRQKPSGLLRKSYGSKVSVCGPATTTRKLRNVNGVTALGLGKSKMGGGHSTKAHACVQVIGEFIAQAPPNSDRFFSLPTDKLYIAAIERDLKIGPIRV